MFICDKCHKPSKPRELCNKLILETRPVTYQNKHMVGKPPRTVERTCETKGIEIVKEGHFCSKCYAKEINLE